MRLVSPGRRERLPASLALRRSTARVWKSDRPRLAGHPLDTERVDGLGQRLPWIALEDEGGQCVFDTQR